MKSESKSLHASKNFDISYYKNENNRLSWPHMTILIDLSQVLKTKYSTGDICCVKILYTKAQSNHYGEVVYSYTQCLIVHIICFIDQRVHIAVSSNEYNYGANIKCS